MTGNNVHDNGDNGFGLDGLQGPGINLVSANTVLNNGRFGIEIKNPNGSGAGAGAGSVVVSGNTVSRTVPIVDVKDIAGIAVFRRAVLPGNVDVPYGVVVSGNNVSGYTQPSSSEGFGIVVEGINHTVSGNTVNGNDVGIQRQAGHLPYSSVTPSIDGDQSNVADTYFGRGNAPYSCALTLSGNILSNILANGIDTRDVGTVNGVNIVTNNNTSEPFCTIQAAIDDGQTLNGHTVNVPAGTYIENVIVNKSLTILGPNSGINPCPVGRGPEAIIKPAISDYLNGTVIDIQAPNVTINGFTIDGDNTSLTSNTVSMGADIDADYGVYSNFNNSKVNYNIIKNVFDWGIYLDGTSNISLSGEAKHNKLQNIPDWAAITASENYYAAIEDNCMYDVWEGVLVESFYNAKPVGASATVKNNTLSTSTTSFVSLADGPVTYPDVRGIRVNLHYSAASPWDVSNNVFTNNIAGTTLSRGIQVLSMQSATSLTLSNNNVTGFDWGYDLWNCPTTSTITVNGGNVTNCNYGIFPNNYDGYGPSNAASSAYIIDGVTITGSVINGIFVKDNTLNSNGATVSAEIKNSTITGGATGILVSGADASANIHNNPSTITGAVIGVDVDGGTATVFQNNITANGTGIRVINGGNLTPTSENFITNNTVDGVRIEASAGTIGSINSNNLSGNVGKAIKNLKAGPAIDATCNWYGSTLPATVAAKINGPVNFNPWLSSGVDGNLGAPGFQPSVVCSGACVPSVFTASISATPTG